MTKKIAQSFILKYIERIFHVIKISFEVKLALDYKSAGVNLEAGDKTVDLIKELAKSTFNKGVLTGIGHFGAFYELDLTGYQNPVMVSSVDGVGTKLKIAIMADKHDTVGQDLVNHCVDDIAVGGAKPLYFLDYMAFGKLVPEKAASIISGFAKACRENEIALIGGETAEMPGLYADDDYDLSGTIVGMVDKNKVIDGRLVGRGDVLIGFKSNGLHTNGYSLARKVVFPKFNLTDKPAGLELNLGEELLRVHKSYLKLIELLKGSFPIHAFSHITGGGIIGNTKRVVPKDMVIDVNWSAWELPAIFQFLQNEGGIKNEEMRDVFNIGIGLIAVVDRNDVEKVLEKASTIGEEGIIIGEIK